MKKVALYVKNVVWPASYMSASIVIIGLVLQAIFIGFENLTIGPVISAYVLVFTFLSLIGLAFKGERLTLKGLLELGDDFSWGG